MKDDFNGIVGMLTHERLMELLTYDQADGVFRWRRPTSRRVKEGDVAGSLTGEGYVEISVDAKRYKATRLAFFYMTGRWPDGVMDHRDGNRTNNRWSNLREVSIAINNQNLRSAMRRSKSGILGVSFRPRTGKWRASITANGLRRQIGEFDSAELAAQAYLAAKRKLHPGCTI